MRYILVLISVLALLWVGQFTYTLFVRPIDQPTTELVGLEKHFNEQDIIGYIYPVRHSFSHSKVLATAAFAIKDYPLPFSLIACKSEIEAIAFASQLEGLPNELQPVRNGNIVLSFITWGDDTIDMANSVKNAFLSY